MWKHRYSLHKNSNNINPIYWNALVDQVSGWYPITLILICICLLPCKPTNVGPDLAVWTPLLRTAPSCLELRCLLKVHLPRGAIYPDSGYDSWRPLWIASSTEPTATTLWISDSWLSPFVVVSVFHTLRHMSGYHRNYYSKGHLSFNGILKEAISSQNMTNPIGFSTQDIIYKCPLLSYTF